MEFTVKYKQICTFIIPSFAYPWWIRYIQMQMLLRLEIGTKHVGQLSMQRAEILRTRHIRLACLDVSFSLLFMLIRLEIDLKTRTICNDIWIIITFFIFIAGPNCAPQTEYKHCVDIQDRETCLTSIESQRRSELGRQIYGSDCAWCPSGPCTNRNSSRCKPEFLLQAKQKHGYETCLPNKQNGKN